MSWLAERDQGGSCPIQQALHHRHCHAPFDYHAACQMSWFLLVFFSAVILPPPRFVPFQCPDTAKPCARPPHILPPCWPSCPQVLAGKKHSRPHLSTPLRETTCAVPPPSRHAHVYHHHVPDVCHHCSLNSMPSCWAPLVLPPQSLVPPCLGPCLIFLAPNSFMKSPRKLMVPQHNANMGNASISKTTTRSVTPGAPYGALVSETGRTGKPWDRGIGKTASSYRISLLFPSRLSGTLVCSHLGEGWLVRRGDLAGLTERVGQSW